jgi:hypothetical protein
MLMAAAERSRGEAGCEWLHSYCAFLAERHKHKLVAGAGGDGASSPDGVLLLGSALLAGAQTAVCT